MERKANILDKMGSLIPGYKGYVERQERRICDKKFRDAITFKMTLAENKIQVKIDNSITMKDMVLMKEWESYRKKLNTLKSRIDYAPYGETSFFSENQIKVQELEEIYSFDLELAKNTDILTSTVDEGEPGEIHEMIGAIEDIFEKRSQYIKQF